MSTNVGKWDDHYTKAPFIMPMGKSEVYRMGAELLSGCGIVEDWGAGYGWFGIVLREVAPGVIYVGVDGSESPVHARIIDDLVTRETVVDGIFMRSVLEHNYNWEALLDNALRSFTQRLVLATFTPFSKSKPHKELQFEDDFDVPTLSLNKSLILEHLRSQPGAVDVVTIDSPNTFYGTETIFCVSRAT